VSDLKLQAKAREVLNAHWQQGISDSGSASGLGSGSSRQGVGQASVLNRQGVGRASAFNRQGVDWASASSRQGAENVWGYTCPNPQRYIWQWLWDSCFHAIVWAELGEADRALLELRTLLATIEPSGFVPHMNFVRDPSASFDFWGRRGASSITQPPMFGHAIAELARRGIDVPEELSAKAARGLLFFVKHRLDSSTGLVTLVHPWESGADNSPRWDGYYATPFGETGWQEEKIGLLRSIERDSDGTPLRNPAFDVASASFSALVAFNLSELGEISGAVDVSVVAELTEAVAACWDDDRLTWVDATVSGRQMPALASPVLDAQLCVLCDCSLERLDAVCENLFDADIFGAPFGPAGVARQHPTYDGDGYWRGSAWPQLTYLFWHVLAKHGRAQQATLLADQLKQGAELSGFAEHWNPQTAKPGGAAPQSWSALCIVTR